MAIVNVDLSEYDSLRNRAKELEEQNKELKEQVKDLKSGSKVIIRTVEREVSPYGFMREGIISESYVGFEDVRLKVEEAMKADINLSIDHRDEQAEALEKERKYLKGSMGKEYEERIKQLKDEYQDNTCKLNDKLYEYKKVFNRIEQLSNTALLDLGGRFFKPKNAIDLVGKINSLSIAKHTSVQAEDSGLKY